MKCEKSAKSRSFFVISLENKSVKYYYKNKLVGGGACTFLEK